MHIQHYAKRVSKLCPPGSGKNFSEELNTEIERYRAKGAFRRWWHRTFDNSQIAKLSTQKYLLEIKDILEQHEQEQMLLLEFIRGSDDELGAYHSILNSHRFLYRIEPFAIGVLECFRVKGHEFNEELFSSRLLKVYRKALASGNTWFGDRYFRFIKRTFSKVKALNKEVQLDRMLHLKPKTKEQYYKVVQRQSERTVSAKWWQFFFNINNFIKSRRGAIGTFVSAKFGAIVADKNEGKKKAVRRKPRIVRIADPIDADRSDGGVVKKTAGDFIVSNMLEQSAGLFKTKKANLCAMDVITSLKNQDRQEDIRAHIESAMDKKLEARKWLDLLMDFAKEAIFEIELFASSAFQARIDSALLFLSIYYGDTTYQETWQWLLDNKEKILEADAELTNLLMRKYLGCSPISDVQEQIDSLSGIVSKGFSKERQATFLSLAQDTIQQEFKQDANIGSNLREPRVTQRALRLDQTTGTKVRCQ